MGENEKWTVVWYGWGILIGIQVFVRETGRRKSNSYSPAKDGK
jgi:hypothetical protein